MAKKKDEQLMLLKRTGELLNSLIQGLEEIDEEDKMKIMELCGKACAVEDGDLQIAERIAQESTSEEEILARLNEEILWCGKWVKEGNTYQTICVQCGCPLVRNKIVRRSGTFCFCSIGWVKTIFETLFRKSVRVELKRSIGRGDSVCEFVVYV